MTAIDSHLTARIQDLLGRYIHPGEPGIAVGVYQDGALVGHAEAGLAVIEHGIPTGPDTVFDIASASKHFTATCLLLLQRDGKLDLNDDVRTYLPELSLFEPVTLRHCLTHTGGLREYYSLSGMSGVPIPGMTEPRLMGLISGQRDLDFPPGSSYSYSNTGYIIAAATIRRLTGQSIAQFAAEQIFGPLGMSASRYRDDLGAIVSNLATGYATRHSAFRRVDVVEETVGDGGVVTSVRDLAAWHRFMATGDVLGEEVRDGLLAPMTLTDGSTLPYANGLSVMTIARRRVYWHSGSIPGFRSVLMYAPSESIGVSVLVNRGDVYPSEIGEMVLQMMLGVGIKPGKYDRVGQAASEKARRKLVGRWHSRETDVFVQFSAGPDGSVQLGGHARYHYTKAGVWRGAGDHVSLGFSVDGDVLAYRAVVGDEPVDRFERYAEPQTDRSAPSGSYFSEELNAYATFDGDAVTIGLNGPHALQSAGRDVFTADEYTLRLTDSGETLLISAEGARRVRFARTITPASPRGMIRGLKG